MQTNFVPQTQILQIELIKPFSFISGPNPVLNITPVIDSTNVTLEWPRPEGRIEYYALKWWPLEIPESIRAKNVSASDLTGLGIEEGTTHIEKILVDDLKPGVEYVFTVFTVSYDLLSDTTTVTTRTS